MEEEIPLRLYFDALIRQWKLIVAITIGVAVIAFVISLLLTPVYRAVALVAVTEPRQVVQFDPRFTADNTSQPLDAYPELAVSDELLQRLLEDQSGVLTGFTSVSELRDAISAQAGSDPSLLKLSVELKSPDLAAAVANEWASLFVTWANDVYSDQGGEQVLFFEQQLVQATDELAEAETMMADFQKENRIILVTNQLDALRDQQAQMLIDQQSLARVLNDLAQLKAQLEAVEASRSVSFGDELAVLALQTKVYNAQSELPVQLQVDSLANGSSSRRELVALLTQLSETAELNLARNTELLKDLEPKVLDLQEEKQVWEMRNGRLSQNLLVAQETYLSLSRKVEEERITAQDTSSGVRLASRAIQPIKPVSPRKILNTAIGGIFGLLMSIFFVFMREWWKSVG